MKNFVLVAVAGATMGLGGIGAMATEPTTTPPVSTPPSTAAVQVAPSTTGTAPLSEYAADNIAPQPSGKGQIVFFRRGGFVGAAISCAVSENGTKLTSLPPGHFGVVNVDPGVHSFTVASEATDTMRVNVEAGKSYYGACTIGMGLLAGRPHLDVSNHDAFFALGTKLKAVKAPQTASSR